MTRPLALGTLYLVPTPLDFACDATADLMQTLPAHTLSMAAQIDCWITENAKSTRAFLKRVAATHPLNTPLQAQHITELPREVHKKGDHDPSTRFDASPLLLHATEGRDMGLVSEAGMPAIADPGASVVRAAHALGIPVRPLVGPISLMLALAASGLNGQNFAFVGYLPQEARARLQRIQALEAYAAKTGQTQIFIETPYRNAALLQALLSALQPSTRLAVGCACTLPEQTFFSAAVGDWKKRTPALPIDLPSVFLLGR